MPNGPAISLKWIQTQAGLWRAASLLLLICALIGPFAYDQTNVPAQFPCTPPSIRLEGDFCGYPLSGFWIVATAASDFASLGIEMITKGTGFNYFVSESLLFVYALLLVLPFITTLAMILSGNRPGLRRLHLLVWGLVGALGLLVGLASLWQYYWNNWGAWLLAGLAVCVVILEVLKTRLESTALPV